jgi:hypothetical protein
VRFGGRTRRRVESRRENPLDLLVLRGRADLADALHELSAIRKI